MALTRPRAHQLVGSDFKQSVRVITTANVNLTGGSPAIVDGVSISLNDRILVTGQTDKSQNGIYKVSSVGAGSNGTWVRTNDADGNEDVSAGMVVMVTSGEAFGDTRWKLTTDDPIVVGTTDLDFEQDSAYAFGTINVDDSTNLVADKVGDTLSVNSGNNINISANNATDTFVINVNSSPSFDSVIATGNISASEFLGNISSTNVVGTVASATTADTVTTAAQPNITSVGTLTSVAVTGNVDAGNLNATSISGTLITATQTNITSIGTLGSLNVTGNIDAGNVNATIIGDVTGNVTGSATTATTAGTVTTDAQPNITSVGNLTSLTVTGNTSSGNISTSGELVVTGVVASDLIPSADETYSLGNGTRRWSNLFLTGNTIQLGNLQLKDTDGVLAVLQNDGSTPAQISAAEVATETGVFADGADFGGVDDEATASLDLGLVTEDETIEIDLAALVQAGLLQPDQVVFPSFTVSSVPLANPAGQMIYVSDESGGSVLAFSDGTNWRRITDRAVIS